MKEQNQFLGFLKDIADIARVNDNAISTGEIDDYFSDMGLAPEQMEMVYDYLCKGHIKVVGYAIPDNVPDTMPGIPPVQDGQAKKNSGVSPHLGRYRREARQKKSDNESEIDEWCRSLVSRKASCKERERLIENYLYIVINIAASYSRYGMPADELIQEGNLALILAVNGIMSDEHTARKLEDSVLSDNTGRVYAASGICEKYFRDAVRQRIIKYTDAQTTRESELAVALGKAELVHEALKELAVDLGRAPSAMELSQFTHISEQEIEDILSLSGDSV